MYGKCGSGYFFMIPDLVGIINKIPSHTYDPQKGIRLMNELEIKHSDPEQLDYRMICELWLREKELPHSLDVLVCSLIRSGLGKLIACLLPSCKFNHQKLVVWKTYMLLSGMSNPPDILKLLRQLPRPEDTWIDFAHFLGYSDDDSEIEAIFANVAPAVRFQMFLRFCLIPDCGQMTSNVALCLRMSGIFDSQTQVFRQDSGNFYTYCCLHLPMHLNLYCRRHSSRTTCSTFCFQTTIVQ